MITDTFEVGFAVEARLQTAFHATGQTLFPPDFPLPYTIFNYLQGRIRISTRKLPPTKDQQEVSGIHIDPTAEEWQGMCLPRVAHRGSELF